MIVKTRNPVLLWTIALALLALEFIGLAAWTLRQAMGKIWKTTRR